ncbi:medium chain dehydrogenase/reductase family protein [Cryptosporangium phraense]|uniref:Zinc-binding dehydrogenase n=1 Tax=Cryptosporangium phraense TaxID=2593070 RepID=A0A545AMT4_9ACTN|nr:medium chain dehydrogenase/reductase family protein [Cryptosporangium phraense]TQS42580.1 zinc-binding dehydrogenase [Cryptosporangium phraense]
MMTHVVLPGIVEPDGLLVQQRPTPTPGPNQVRVSVEASGVSFAEQQMRRGKYYDQPPFPFTPGYDLVGTVAETGPGVDPTQKGRRVAVLTKTGGWATDAIVDAGDLVGVPAGIDPADAETVVVNGITAWQMLHRRARVRRGGTILVHGANGGVGSTLVQLARHAGIRVLGTGSARNQAAIEKLGAEPIDYRGDVPARVRELAPDGVDAVFDHVGGPGLTDSYRLLGRGGTLVSYGSAATKNDPGNSQLPVLRLIAKLAWWNVLPNGHRATFYNIWSGRRLRRAVFQARLREDLGQVLQLLAEGAITAQVAARLPLRNAADALKLAESGTVTGKVVLVP